MESNDNEFELLNGDCCYLDLSTVPPNQFLNSFIHLSVRSLVRKTGEIEALFKIAGLPQALLLTETWLTTNSPLLNIDNYHFYPHIEYAVV